MRYAFFSILISLFSLSLSARVVNYEPAIVELQGVVESQVFPGRPGYESIKNNDEIERGWYFRLTSPIDVQAQANSQGANKELVGEEDPNPERNVKIIQLTSYSDKIMTKLPRVVGKNIVLKGYLFHAFSAHHHARVLMLVDQIKVNGR